jgi:hypothetical protein
MILNSPLPTEHERKRLRAHFASRAISWIKASAPGAENLYHRGLLLEDRLTNPALDIEAQVFYLAGQEGYADLVQMRLDAGGCAYIARRSPKRMTEAREELFRIKFMEEDNAPVSQIGQAHRARVTRQGGGGPEPRRVLSTRAASAAFRAAGDVA